MKLELNITLPEETPDIVGKRSRFVTMGQEHKHLLTDSEYPVNFTVDRNIVVLVTVPEGDEDRVRDYIFELFGPQWCFEYQNKPDMSYFPRGVMAVDILNPLPELSHES